MEMCELGNTVRCLRKDKGLPLRHISERTGYSISYLSQIERGKANPSIGTLHTITQAMGETFASLFQTGRNSPTSGSNLSISPSPRQTQLAWVVRKNERKGLVLPRTRYQKQLLSPDLNRRIEFLRGRIPPGTKTGVYEHEGEECGIVLRGTLECRVGEETFTLNAGDSIYFYSSTPHEFQNKGNKTVETIWAITPPSF